MRKEAGSVATKPDSAFAKVFEIEMGAAGFETSHAAQAAEDGLTLEAETGAVDFRDDATSRELSCAGALVELVDGVEDGVSAAQAGVGELGL